MFSMRLIKSTIHSSLNDLEGSMFQRRAARGIMLDGNNILLVYTQRYEDYALPGGGVSDDEDIVSGLIRELEEETGARNIRNIEAFGCYEEYRPWYKSDYDIMHMLSYCYVCQIDPELGTTQLEDYEIANGMEPVWVNIFDAIRHNEQTMAHSDKQGMSIERETTLLKLIAKELLALPELAQAI